MGPKYPKNQKLNRNLIELDAPKKVSSATNNRILVSPPIGETLRYKITF